MAVYDIFISYNDKTEKTSFALSKDQKDNLDPTEAELKIYLSRLKLIMDKTALKLKEKMDAKNSGNAA
jgi:hypothetical protein